MIEMRQLEVFMAIWKTKSFSLAAKSLYLTQPTISGHIKALEDLLGVQLFHRSVREITPTKAGEVLYPFARKILRINNQAQQEIAKFLGQEKGKLEIGGSNIPGQYILPGLVSEFKSSRPRVQVMVTISDTASIIESVASGNIELGMVGARLKNKNLEFTPCFRDRLVLIVPSGHPLAHRKGVRIQELLNEPFVIREQGSGTRYTTEMALEAQGIYLDDLNVVAEMGSTEAVRQAVKNGLGCAILSEKAVADDLVYGLLHAPAIESIDLRRQFFVIRHGRRQLSPLAKAFFDFLAPLCGKDD